MIIEKKRHYTSWNSDLVGYIPRRQVHDNLFMTVMASSHPPPTYPYRTCPLPFVKYQPVARLFRSPADPQADEYRASGHLAPFGSRLEAHARTAARTHREAMIWSWC